MAATAFQIPEPAAAAAAVHVELHARAAHAGRDGLRRPDRRLAACVDRAGVEHGILNAQCLHTSAALLINENEPLLHEDFRRCSSDGRRAARAGSTTASRSAR